MEEYRKQYLEEESDESADENGDSDGEGRSEDETKRDGGAEEDRRLRTGSTTKHKSKNPRSKRSVKSSGVNRRTNKCRVM